MSAAISHSRVLSWLHVNVGRKRRILALSSVMVLSAGLASAEQKPEIANLVAGRLDITVTEIGSFSRNESETHFGNLEWRGGLQISSTHQNFGGWSGLALEADSRRLFAVSDGGAWMTGELTYDGAKLAGLKNPHIGPLLTAEGQPLKRNRDRDAEAVLGFLDFSKTLLIISGLSIQVRKKLAPRWEKYGAISWYPLCPTINCLMERIQLPPGFLMMAIAFR